MTLERYRDSFMNHVIRIRLKGRPRLGFILKLAPPRMQVEHCALSALFMGSLGSER